MKQIFIIAFLMLSLNVNAQELKTISAKILNELVEQGKEFEIASEKYVIVTEKRTNKKGVIDYKGDLIIPYDYSCLALSNDSLFIVSNNCEEYGIIDNKGNVLLPIVYHGIVEPFYVMKFHDGMGVVKDMDDRCGYIDTNCKLVIPCKYSKASRFYNGVAVVVDENGNYKFINKTGQVDEASSRLLDSNQGLSFYDDCIINGNRIIFVNTRGEVKSFIANYDGISSSMHARFFKKNDNNLFDEGLVDVEKNGKFGLLNKDGKEILPCVYDDVFAEVGCVFAQKDGKYAIFDRQGKQLTSFMFTSCYYYSRNLLLVKRDNKYEFWSATGNNLTGKFETISFENNNPEYFLVKDNNNYVVCDGNGNQVFYSKNQIRRIYDDFAVIQDGGTDLKYGVINRYGVTVLPCEYDAINSDEFEEKKLFEYGIFHVNKNGKSFYVDCVNVSKLFREYDYLNDQASDALKKDDKELTVYYLKKADEKLAIAQLYPNLYPSDFVGRIKEERAKRKQWIEGLSK